MSKQITNPFFDFDMTKFVADFDPTKLMGEFSKNLAEMKIPGLDVEALVEAQRRNVEALTTANRAALEGVQALVKRQAEILQQTMDEVSGAMQGLATSGTPQEGAAKQAELLKAAFEKAIANARELAEMAAKSNTEAADAINKRFTEALDEVKVLALSLKK